jgi:hypothetical protein
MQGHRYNSYYQASIKTWRASVYHLWVVWIGAVCAGALSLEHFRPVSAGLIGPAFFTLHYYNNRRAANRFRTYGTTLALGCNLKFETIKDVVLPKALRYIINRLILICPRTLVKPPHSITGVAFYIKWNYRFCN